MAVVFRCCFFVKIFEDYWESRKLISRFGEALFFLVFFFGRVFMKVFVNIIVWKSFEIGNRVLVECLGYRRV